MSFSLNRRLVVTALAALALCANVKSLSMPAHAEPAARVRVIMMEEPGCRFCAAWDRDVGRIYAATPEGQFAPLLRVRRGAAELKGLTKPAIYTPTFIVMTGDKEAGRITGYPGESYFWEELKVILTDLGYGASKQ